MAAPAAAAAAPGSPVVSDLERYMFDLQGFIVIKRAVGPEALAKLNAGVDQSDPREPGRVGGLAVDDAKAIVQNPESAWQEQQGFGDSVAVMGTTPVFDDLIDHPSWIEHLRMFIGGEPAFLNGQAIIRWPGQVRCHLRQVA